MITTRGLPLLITATLVAAGGCPGGAGGRHDHTTTPYGETEEAESSLSSEATGAPAGFRDSEPGGDAVVLDAVPADARALARLEEERRADGGGEAATPDDDGDEDGAEEDRPAPPTELVVPTSDSTGPPPPTAGAPRPGKSRRVVPTPPRPSAKLARRSRGGGPTGGGARGGGGTLRSRARRSMAPRSSAPPPPSAPMGAPAAATGSIGGGGRPAASPPTRLVATPRGGRRHTRVLTAATVADVDRRAAHVAYLARHGAERSSTSLDLGRRVRFRVVDAAGAPVHDARITLMGTGFRVEGRTHADGYWDFFPSVAAPQAGGPTVLYVQAGRVTAQATVPIPAQGDGRDLVVRLPGARAATPRILDLAFLIDVTGSMGDELQYVTDEVVGIVERVRSAVPGVRVRVAATFYRDRGDAVPIEQIPFSTNMRRFTTHMGYVVATGGGDYPEDLNLGLAAAITTLQWSTEPAARALVVIADAPPQMYPGFQYTYRAAMTEASARGIRLMPVAASGANRTVEYIFRAMGAFTSTPYVYLTDDSGIGSAHMEADTDSVSVEMFSDALTRLLISDLQGHGMHEPPGQSGPALMPRQ